MSCETSCFEMQIKCCTDILIAAGLTPATTYQAILTKHGSNKLYEREFISDADGSIVIDKSLFPPGFLAYGFIEIKIKTGEDFADDQTIKFNNIDYNCLLVELIDIDGD